MGSQRAHGANRHGARDLGSIKRIIPALLSAVVVFTALYRLGGSIMVCSLGSSIAATVVDLGTGHWAGSLADRSAVVRTLVVAVIGFLATLDLVGIVHSWAALHMTPDTPARIAVVVGAAAARCVVLLGGYVAGQRADAVRRA